MNSISIDVLITTFNSEKYIKETINSVLNQTYKNYRIIIVDDCSTDKTFDICKKYRDKYKDKIKLYKLKKNSSSAAIPRNFGIKKCKSEYVAFLDSDDIWMNSKLEYQVSKINNSTKFMFTNCKYFRNKKEINSTIYYFRTLLQIIFSYLIKQNREWLFLYNPIPFSSVMIRRNIFKKLQFNTSHNFVGIEDLEFWFNIFKTYNINIVYEIKPLVFIRRRLKSLHSDYNFQTIKSINLISNMYLNKKNFINIYIFLFSIAYKSIRPLLKKLINFFKLNFRQFIFSIILTIYLIFFSPLFKLVGNNLLVETVNNKKIETVVIYSGHEWESYVNEGYKLRFADLQNILKYNSDINIYVLGRIQVIAEQRIIESLLQSKGVNKEKINIIYEDLGSSSKNLENLYNRLISKNIDKVLFVSSPYLSKRVKLIWDKFSDKISINFYKTVDWPTDKLRFFEKSNKKKIILYEYSAIMYNYLINRF
jgi:teichuronic acid biosynthesis glycosyltransferase TuaG